METLLRIFNQWSVKEKKNKQNGLQENNQTGSPTPTISHSSDTTETAVDLRQNQQTRTKQRPKSSFFSRSVSQSQTDVSSKKRNVKDGTDDVSKQSFGHRKGSSFNFFWKTDRKCKSSERDSAHNKLNQSDRYPKRYFSQQDLSSARPLNDGRSIHDAAIIASPAILMEQSSTNAMYQSQQNMPRFAVDKSLNPIDHDVNTMQKTLGSQSVSSHRTYSTSDQKQMQPSQPNINERKKCTSWSGSSGEDRDLSTEHPHREDSERMRQYNKFHQRTVNLDTLGKWRNEYRPSLNTHVEEQLPQPAPPPAGASKVNYPVEFTNRWSQRKANGHSISTSFVNTERHPDKKFVRQGLSSQATTLERSGRHPFASFSTTDLNVLKEAEPKQQLQLFDATQRCDSLQTQKNSQQLQGQGQTRILEKFRSELHSTPISRIHCDPPATFRSSSMELRRNHSNSSNSAALNNHRLNENKTDCSSSSSSEVENLRYSKQFLPNQTRMRLLAQEFYGCENLPVHRRAVSNADIYTQAADEKRNVMTTNFGGRSHHDTVLFRSALCGRTINDKNSLSQNRIMDNTEVQNQVNTSMNIDRSQVRQVMPNHNRSLSTSFLQNNNNNKQLNNVAFVSWENHQNGLKPIISESCAGLPTSQKTYVETDRQDCYTPTSGNNYDCYSDGGLRNSHSEYLEEQSLQTQHKKTGSFDFLSSRTCSLNDQFLFPHREETNTSKTFLEDRIFSDPEILMTDSRERCVNTPEKSSNRFSNREDEEIKRKPVISTLKQTQTNAVINFFQRRALLKQEKQQQQKKRYSESDITCRRNTCEKAVSRQHIISKAPNSENGVNRWSSVLRRLQDDNHSNILNSMTDVVVANQMRTSLSKGSLALLQERNDSKSKIPLEKELPPSNVNTHAYRVADKTQWNCNDLLKSSSNTNLRQTNQVFRSISENIEESETPLSISKTPLKPLQRHTESSCQPVNGINDNNDEQPPVLPPRKYYPHSDVVTEYYAVHTPEDFYANHLQQEATKLSISSRGRGSVRRREDDRSDGGDASVMMIGEKVFIGDCTDKKDLKMIHEDQLTISRNAEINRNRLCESATHSDTETKSYLDSHRSPDASKGVQKASVTDRKDENTAQTPAESAVTSNCHIQSQNHARQRSPFSSLNEDSENPSNSSCPTGSPSLQVKPLVSDGGDPTGKTNFEKSASLPFRRSGFEAQTTATVTKSIISRSSIICDLVHSLENFPETDDDDDEGKEKEEEDNFKRIVSLLTSRVSNTDDDHLHCFLRKSSLRRNVDFIRALFKKSSASDDEGLSTSLGVLLRREDILQRKMSDYTKESRKLSLGALQKELLALIEKRLDKLSDRERQRLKRVAENKSLEEKVTKVVRLKTDSKHFEKFLSYLEQLEKVIQLLLNLSIRLSKTEDALNQFPDENNVSQQQKVVQKKLMEKRRQVRERIQEAMDLKLSIDRQSEKVSENLSECLTEAEYKEFLDMVRTKCHLALQAQLLDESKQLSALQKNILVDRCQSDVTNE